MEITVNNKAKTVRQGDSLTDLIQQMELDEKRIAIEYNRAILNREQFASIILQVDDNIEIVSLVGGG